MYQFEIVTLFKIIQRDDSGGWVRHVATFSNKKEAETFKKVNWKKLGWIYVEESTFIKLFDREGESYYELASRDPQPITMSQLGKEII